MSFFHDVYRSFRECLRTIVVVPTLLFLAICVALFTTMTEAMSQIPIASRPDHESSTQPNVHFAFSAPTSYFLPSLSSTEPSSFDPTTTNFGLISKPYDSDVSLPNVGNYTDWQRFSHHVSELNTKAPDHISYHVLYLARHGQGYHNLAERYYGTEAWDCYYSLLDGDLKSNITWSDAHLSKLGSEQARLQSRFWTSQIEREKMLVPEKYFVSPMERACLTAEITFQPLQQSGTLGVAEFIPTVKELLREANGVHTCDRRSKRSVIAANYLEWKIEDGFSEDDELWDPVYRETDQALTYRAALLLDDILRLSQDGSAGKGSFLSLTAHGGINLAITRAIGHREFQINVGSAIAVLVKAERQEGKRPTQHFGGKGQTAPSCVSDPLQAGLPGYKSFKEYVDEVEANASVLSIKLS